MLNKNNKRHTSATFVFVIVIFFSMLVTKWMRLKFVTISTSITTIVWRFSHSLRFRSENVTLSFRAGVGFNVRFRIRRETRDRIRSSRFHLRRFADHVAAHALSTIVLNQVLSIRSIYRLPTLHRWLVHRNHCIDSSMLRLTVTSWRAEPQGQ